jgi:Xaa-Pro aminopeptidase
MANSLIANVQDPPSRTIPPQAPGVPELFHGIGIRIEDDVVVGSDRAEVLTEAAPRMIPEIEALVASSRMT